MRPLPALLAIALTIIPASAQSQRRLEARFTPDEIKIDGSAEPAWSAATPQPIAICVNPRHTAKLPNCKVSAIVRALWRGPLLYLFFDVADPDISTASPVDTRRSSVQIFVDQYDDKFPKFEEDDGSVTITPPGEKPAQQTGNRPNANLPYFPTIWSTHLNAWASVRTPAGYTVELAWSIGDLPLRNGTKLGMDFAVNAANPSTNNVDYQLFWSSGDNKGVNDSAMWGDVVLTGYDAASPMPLNAFLLGQNIRKAAPSDSSATGLIRGIWRNDAALERARADAVAVLDRVNRQVFLKQAEIDSANVALESAMQALRRAGKFPDPLDLPVLATLPDPFTFFNAGRPNGAVVKTPADWSRRRTEIRDIAQYYEFGYMPAPPESLSATSVAGANGAQQYRAIEVTIADRGRTASFKPILFLPPAGAAPYPVIVQLDFRTSPAAPVNPAFLRGGYAVLSIPTSDAPAFNASGIASDDGNHTGAFFTLYPYKLDADGNDRGVLLAWAWGASRGVDALHYLALHDSTYTDLLDLNKLVVTGFSRWGKAALLAGFLDDRFQVTAPGGSGSGGAAPYRYDSFGNVPARSAPFGNVYPWGRSTGAETLGDHVRHQTHNSNEMIRRFLNDDPPLDAATHAALPRSSNPRMYQTATSGYGDRLPFDHHEMIAAIAPRAVIVINTNDDYADNAEGDAIGYEGAKPVFEFLGVPQNLALDIFMGGGGHSLKPSQAQDIVTFANFVLFHKPMPDEVRSRLATDPYREAGTYSTYYGGLKTMMPYGSRLVN